MDDSYNYSLDEYVNSDFDEYLRQIEISKTERNGQERIQAQMFLQDLIEVILQAGATTEAGAEEKFAKIIE